MSPMNRARYPADWDDIARDIKECVGYVCQECGQQCRRPGEPFDTHKRTLTVAHLDHNPDAEIVTVAALCAPCHLRYDAQRKAHDRRVCAAAQRGQPCLL